MSPVPDQVMRSLQSALAAGDELLVDMQLRQLADTDKKYSYASVAALFEEGFDGIEKNLNLAFRWYTRSATEERDSIGYFGLGRFYLHGKCVEKNYQKAISLFETANNMGSAEAAILLGYCHMNGVGTVKNIDQAERFRR